MTTEALYKLAEARHFLNRAETLLDEAAAKETDVGYRADIRDVRAEVNAAYLSIRSLMPHPQSAS